MDEPQLPQEGILIHHKSRHMAQKGKPIRDHANAPGAILSFVRFRGEVAKEPSRESDQGDCHKRSNDGGRRSRIGGDVSTNEA